MKKLMFPLLTLISVAVLFSGCPPTDTDGTGGGGGAGTTSSVLPSTSTGPDSVGDTFYAVIAYKDSEGWKCIIGENYTRRGNCGTGSKPSGYDPTEVVWRVHKVGQGIEYYISLYDTDKYLATAPIGDPWGNTEYAAVTNFYAEEDLDIFVDPHLTLHSHGKGDQGQKLFTIESVPYAGYFLKPVGHSSLEIGNTFKVGTDENSQVWHFFPATAPNGTVDGSN